MIEFARTSDLLACSCARWASSNAAARSSRTTTASFCAATAIILACRAPSSAARTRSCNVRTRASSSSILSSALPAASARPFTCTWFRALLDASSDSALRRRLRVPSVCCSMVRSRDVSARSRFSSASNCSMFAKSCPRLSASALDELSSCLCASCACQPPSRATLRLATASRALISAASLASRKACVSSLTPTSST